MLRRWMVAMVVAGSAAMAWPCTNILVTKGASSDSSTFIAYASDSHEFYGDLYFAPARDSQPGAMREIIDWDSGKRLGEIPDVPHAYQVVGLMNEHQVMVGETTFGGRSELEGPSGIIDYGSLMFLALERARTAREAIQVMGDLVTKYGYASEGESI